MKNYIVKQLTQSSAWIGAGVIIAALILPRSFIIVLGIILIVVPDNQLQKKFSEWSPAVRKALRPMGE